MRFLSYVLLACLLGFIPTAFAQSFEGTIKMSHSQRPNQHFLISLQGSQSVLQPIGQGLVQGVRMIADASNGTYVLVQGNDVSDGRNIFQAEPDYTKVNLTGNQKKIDGHNCVEVQGLRDGQAFTAWLAPDLKHLDPNRFLMGGTQLALGDFRIPGRDGLIIEIQTIHPVTGAAYSLHNEVKAESVDDTLFTY
ncbi:MAG: hypothetical protein AAF206_09755 [Bacteroidota bacterium]